MQKRKNKKAAVKPFVNKKPETAAASAEDVKVREDAEYQRRFDRHFDELKWLYMEVYQNEWMFDELCKQMYRFIQNEKNP